MGEIVAVYAAGLLQGLALVTFPAASAVLTSPSGYGLSSGAYGAMFAPQTIMAVAAALLGARLGARWGQKRVLLVGLAANLLSMALLVASRFVMGSHGAAFALLLGATACMGIGFGLTVPAINVLAASLFPRRVNVAVLALNALLGLGTALAPAQRETLIGWMGGNTTGAERIRAGVPVGWYVADKTGGGDYGTANDVAVLWPLDQPPIVLAVFHTQAAQDAKPRNDVLAAAAQIVAQALVKG